MKELKNPYNYDLSKLKALNVLEDGTIVGGTNYSKNFKVGEEFMFPSGETIKVLEVKELIVVKEL